MSRRGAEKFWLYIRWRRRGDRTFCPWPCNELLPHGETFGWTAFAKLENGEKNVSTRHSRAVRTASEGKRLLNWQIKQWAEGVRDGTTPLFELQEALPELPKWVWKAVLNQASKKGK